MSSIDPELKFLVDSLRSYESNCVEAVVDFSKMEFHCTDTSMWLTLRDGTFPRPDLHFRINPHDSKDTVAIHAHKQLCKFLKVPHSFFVNNRPKMRETIVRNWLAGLVPEDKGSMRLLKLRVCKDLDIIRAVLPENSASYPNFRVLESLSRFGEDVGMRLVSVVGDEMDSPSMEVLVVFGQPLEWSGSNYLVGLMASFGDIDTKNIVVDAVLLSESGQESYVLSFAHGPMLDLPYNSVEVTEMDRILAGLPHQLLERMPHLVNKLQLASSQEFLGIDATLDILLNKVAQDSVKKKIRREFYREGANEEYTSARDVARGLTSVARSYDGLARKSLEKLAGSFLGLDLPSLDGKGVGDVP